MGARENLDPLPTLDNAPAVREMVGRLIADVYEGRLSPQRAAGLATLINLQLRATEATNIDHRMKKLEEKMALLQVAKSY